MSKPTTKRKPPAGKVAPAEKKAKAAPPAEKKTKAAAPAEKKAKAAPAEKKAKAAPAAKKTKTAPAEKKTKAARAAKKTKAAPAEKKTKASPAEKKTKAAPVARKTRAKAAPPTSNTDSELSPGALESQAIAEPVGAEGADAEAPESGVDALRAGLQIVADEAPVESSIAARAVAGAPASVDVGELDGDEAHLYLKGLIEALLFVAEAPLTVKELARAAKIDRKRAQELLDELRAGYEKRGIQIQEVAGGFCFRSNADYAEYVRGHLAQRPVRLSRPQLETLAIIAYRQPITRPEIDDIRGVDSGPVLKGLLERDLVKILGKKDEPGRPMLYGTSAGFLDLFSMQSLQDLPTLKEFTELSEESRRRFEQQLGEDAPDGPVDLSHLEATVSASSDPSEFDDPPEAASADDAGAEIDPDALGPQEMDVTNSEQDEPESELEESDQLGGAESDLDDDHADDDDADDDDADDDDADDDDDDDAIDEDDVADQDEDDDGDDEDEDDEDDEDD